ncbi:MAG: aryl-sulfate sulfotransferase [Candidatus Heimdallarchaeaceae archaeon]
MNNSMWCPFHDGIAFNKADITHSNTIFYDDEKDIIYYNARNVNTFYAIEHKSGNVLWGLGEYGNFTLFDIHGRQKKSLFYHAHAVEKIDNHTFILFDNNRHNQTDSYDRHSRIVEITLNYTDMTARETWQWIAPTEYYLLYWGDADRLPNGNRLGVFGTIEHCGDYSIGARIVEVNSKGKIVWEMKFPKQGDYIYGIYRAERFRLKPSILGKDSLDVVLGKDIQLNWTIFSAIRLKNKTNGTYEIYVNDTRIKTDILSFQRYWQPTKLSVKLKGLTKETYNVTLAIKDNKWRTEVKITTIHIQPFFIYREGKTTSEIGGSSQKIIWFGETCSPLEYKILVNQSEFLVGIWTGQNITLEYSTFPADTYYVSILMYNASKVVYNDSLRLIIYPSDEPQILNAPSDETIQWNETTILQWLVKDNTLNIIEVYQNGILAENQTVAEREILFNWTISTLDEGSYNITIIIKDSTGKIATDTCIITIIPPSPPVIINRTSKTEFQWGYDYLLFKWEVHGDNCKYAILRNGTTIQTGILLEHNIVFSLNNWQMSDWRPGNYKITCEVIDKYGLKTTSNMEITIFVYQSDPYGSAVVKELTNYVYEEENAIGMPDNRFARIMYDYSNGYITIDMGAGEEIIDKEGMDFQVIAEGEEYLVSVSNSLSEAFVNVGRGKGNESFDLQTAGIKEARYVQIQRFGTENYTYLDAIVAIHFNKYKTENQPPILISGPENATVYDNTSYVVLTWTFKEDFPWRYRIYSNGEEMRTGAWSGEQIQFVLIIEKEVREYNVTIYVVDLFNNAAQNTVIIKVQQLTEKTPLYTTIIIAVLIGEAVFKTKKRRIKNRKVVDKIVDM